MAEVIRASGLPSSHTAQDPEQLAKPDYVFDYAQEGEVDRIDFQHRLLVKLTGGLLPDYVDRSRLTAIADVATGTGYEIHPSEKSKPPEVLIVRSEWLNDTHDLLEAGRTAGTGRIYHGFDINASVFAPRSPSFRHTVHDLTQPFPEELHGKFDLVHIRYTFSFLKREAVEDAVRHIAALAAPGGHIVWTENDVNESCLMPPYSERHAQIFQLSKDWPYVTGACMDLPDRLVEAGKELGLSLCEKKLVHSGSVLSKKELRGWESQVMRMWLPNGLPAVVPGLAGVALQEMAGEMMADILATHANGETWSLAVARIVFRKIYQLRISASGSARLIQQHTSYKLFALRSKRFWKLYCRPLVQEQTLSAPPIADTVDTPFAQVIRGMADTEEFINQEAEWGAIKGGKQYRISHQKQATFPDPGELTDAGLQAYVLKHADFVRDCPSDRFQTVGIAPSWQARTS